MKDKRAIHSKSWFYDHIGRCIYRDEMTCRCYSCRINAERGLVVKDEQHAEYLFLVQHDLSVEYRDAK